MVVVTNHMLRQKLAQLNREVRFMSANSNPRQILEDEIGTVLLYETKITKVKGEYVINENGVEARLFSPVPGVHWKCLVNPDKNGVSTLTKPLEALFIDDGSNVYCLGTFGISSEFEIRLQIGTNEVRLNDLFVNVQASHLVVNGLEEKR